MVFDVVYDPWPTTLAAAADRAGARVLDGLDLLVGQAVAAGRADDRAPALARGPPVAGDAALAARNGGSDALRHRGTLARVLRWLTAGESHGPALVAVLEGMPAHVQVTTADVADALARRRLGFGRGARMKFEADAVTPARRRPPRRDPGRSGRDRGRQHRVAQVGDGDVGRPRGRRGARRAGPQRQADPAPPRPRRPGRHAEVRLRRGPARPGARQRPGDRGPGRARLRGPPLPRAGVRRADPQPRRRAGLGQGARRRRPAAGGPRRPSTTTRCAASTATRAPP